MKKTRLNKPEKNSSKLYQRDKITKPLHIRDFNWTEKQKRFIELGTNRTTNIIICKGVAGTGKSLLAMYCALTKLNEKNIGDIYYTRVPVESSSYGIGFVKGEVSDKMLPYLQPALHKIEELLPEDEKKFILEDERIKGIPIGYLRGLSLNACIVIADELQNGTVQDQLLIMSRLGRHAKLFLMGDVQQSDVKNSGFSKIYDLFDNDEAKAKGIHTFEFTSADIMRNDILAYIIEKFESLNVCHSPKK